MSQSLAKDFNFRSLLKFAFPSIIMMIFMSLYSIVDGFFIAQYVDSMALSAANIVYPAVSILLAVGIMFGTGGSAVVAAKIGHGKKVFLSAGRFAALVGTTKETLFHYDEIGLFVPKRRGTNGYRYYAMDQIETFDVIGMLRELGMPLAEIPHKSGRPAKVSVPWHTGTASGTPLQFPAMVLYNNSKDTLPPAEPCIALSPAHDQKSDRNHGNPENSPFPVFPVSEQTQHYTNFDFRIAHSKHRALRFSD